MSAELRYAFEPYSAEHDRHFIRLMGQEGFERDPAQLQWTFSPPAGSGWVAVAREEGGEIVGLMGLVPARLSLSGEIVRSGLMIDLIIDPIARGRGVFGVLAQAAHEGAAAQGAALVWGFPNEAAGRGWYGRYGWTRLGAPPLLMRPLRTGFIARRMSARLTKLDAPLPIKRTAAPPNYRLLDRLDADADALAAGFSKRVQCATVRDRDWLNWRLFERPGVSYRTVSCSNDSGSMQALVSTRIVDRDGTEFLYVIEAMSRSPADDPLLKALLRHEIAQGASAGAEAALCWSAKSAPNRSVYKGLGFLPVPEALRPANTSIGMRALSPAGAAAADAGAWYVSFADLDTI